MRSLEWAASHLCHDADGAAAFARTRGTSDSVDICLAVSRQVVVDDNLETNSQF